ncbi:MAG TPA: RluA family pseudouridine synthase [Mycobacteriales bacterium]|jgi:23S rRNA pseudouridine1911/1915/1917 synthase|nr:RluA family pseudouridine synthase [Mycobacteriales bacterium]
MTGETETQLRSLPVPEGLDGLRVDVALSRLFGLSRVRAAQIAARGGAQLDGQPVGKSDRLHAGGWLEVDLPLQRAWEPPVEAEPVGGLRVLYEDDDVVVVVKPAGVASHPSPGYEGPTVTGGLAATGRRLATSGAAERQGVVHRLDVGTSGLMVLARSEPAYAHLKDQFRARTVDKHYRALVQGHPDPLRGTVDAPIDRHPGHAYRFAVVAGGRPSVTHYDTLEATRAASLLDVKLETGRTHQIRVHMAALRHPCVGDVTYGADPTLAARLHLTRQWLHAATLAFDHPRTGKRVEFASDPPADLDAALRTLRAES